MLLIILIGVLLSFAPPESAQPELPTRSTGKPVRRHWFGRCTTGRHCNPVHSVPPTSLNRAESP
uniref:hypothetical protein n=1 Tax=Pseudomonas sp. RW407 TaxID=2202894 RepID=UPI0011B49547|nr:hypothetical protein [Pseudomonas sp. RW407]